MSRFYSLGEVSRILGIPPHKLTYAHSVGRVPEPARVMGRRGYRRGDILQLARWFKLELMEPAHIGLGEEAHV